MNIKEIIQKLHTTMTDSSGQESHFESWMTLNEGICDAIDALKALDKQEPVAWEQFYPDIGKPKFVAQPYQEPIGYVNEGETDRLIAQKQETIEGLNRDYDLLFAEHQLLLKKEWVGLTDEEIADIVIEMNGNEPTAPFWRDLAQAIEAAHGIKE